ncbi:aldehyde dehydrogenase (NADP(+)) [Canibacter oris]|uniref:NADP-dependent aldehyde dehydrogenase n=1 Tax=Canibacter oris TaxID=1365628 RepID=A0A840DI75_9MICO|nr:aldehyde dehydrogenase (NADP(+)) [Canibacter oris]MBB4071475.1 NADP-dependent aldehyde dehydrogenase [Canibacter oris]
MTVETLVANAHKAYRSWSRAPRETRALALEAIADGLVANSEKLVAIAREETNLRLDRLTAELHRTSFQLRLFAEVLRDGVYLDVRIDEKNPDWATGPRPDLRRTNQALGPVVIFAASNFPFAFSVAGGDTASAIAAGCAVILKAHNGHPELSRETAAVVTSALHNVGAPEHLFQLIESRADGIAVLQAPEIKAGAFTGSIPAGRALFDIATSRPEPIPFFGELGSLNPVFVTKQAALHRENQIALEYLSNITLGSGQFCTKPGIIVVPRDSGLSQAIATAALPEGQKLLNERIHQGYVDTLQELQQHTAIELLAQGDEPYDTAPGPTVLSTTATAILDNYEEICRECFGPTGLVVTYEDEAEMLAFARILDGQLTATICGEENDEIVAPLLDELREKAGRVLWNQWSPGAAVTYAQQHGGPYPATTAVSSTAIGTAAIYRFLRPVAYQGFPQQFLPEELRDKPQTPLLRRVNGVVGGVENQHSKYKPL